MAGEAVQVADAAAPCRVAEWVGRYTGGLRRRLCRHRLPCDCEDDVLQEVWLHVLLRPPSDEVAAAVDRLAAWLAGVLRHKAADVVRQLSRHRYVSLDDVLTAGGEPAPLDSPPEPYSNLTELAERTRTAISHLSVSSAGENVRLLELRYISGKSVAEIAAITGLTPEVVSARLQRAKRRVRNVVRGRGGGKIRDKSDGLCVMLAEPRRLKNGGRCRRSGQHRRVTDEASKGIVVK